MITVSTAAQNRLQTAADEAYGVRVTYVGWQKHVVSTNKYRRVAENYVACLNAIAVLEGYSDLSEFIIREIGEVTAVDTYRSY